MALQITYTTTTNLIEKIIEIADTITEDIVIAQLPGVATVSATPITITSGVVIPASGTQSVVVQSTQVVPVAGTSIPFTTVSGLFASVSGVIQMGTEEIFFTQYLDEPDPTFSGWGSGGITTLSGLVRGWNSTTPQEHPTGTSGILKEFWTSYEVPYWSYTMISGTPSGIAEWRNTNYANTYYDANRSIAHKVWSSNKTTYSGSSQFTEFKNLEIEDYSFFEMNVPSGTISGVSNVFVGVEFPIERTTKYLNMDLLPVGGKEYITSNSGTNYYYLGETLVDQEDFYNTITGTLVPIYFGYSQDNIHWTYATPSGVDDDGNTLYETSDNIDDIDAYVMGSLTAYEMALAALYVGWGMNIGFASSSSVFWDFKDKFRAKYYKTFFTNYDMGTTGSGEPYYIEFPLGLDGTMIVISGVETLISGSGDDAYDAFIRNYEILQSESGYDVRSSSLEVDRPTTDASSYWRSTGSSVGWDLGSYSGVPPTITGTWATLASATSSVSTDDGSTSTAIISGRFYCSATQWECRIYEVVNGTTSGTIDSQTSPVEGWIPITTIKTYNDGDSVSLSYQIRINGSLSGITRIVKGEGVRFTS